MKSCKARRELCLGIFAPYFVLACIYKTQLFLLSYSSSRVVDEAKSNAKQPKAHTSSLAVDCLSLDQVLPSSSHTEGVTQYG